MNSGLTSKDQLKELRSHPAGSRMTLKEPADFGAKSEPTEEEVEEVEEVEEAETRTG